MPVGALWRRGHKPKTPMGVAFISVLKDFVLKMAELSSQIPCQRAYCNRWCCDWCVKGTGRNGQAITVNAKAVILTTGGFGANTKMLQKNIILTGLK